jgi:hypothetical protein
VGKFRPIKKLVTVRKATDKKLKANKSIELCSEVKVCGLTVKESVCGLRRTTALVSLEYAYPVLTRLGSIISPFRAGSDVRDRTLNPTVIARRKVHTVRLLRLLAQC